MSRTESENHHGPSNASNPYATAAGPHQPVGDQATERHHSDGTDKNRRHQPSHVLRALQGRVRTVRRTENRMLHHAPRTHRAARRGDPAWRHSRYYPGDLRILRRQRADVHAADVQRGHDAIRRHHHHPAECARRNGAAC
ncbi:hypothetical protein EP30_04340 [Bifidobacterium sp. UTCIF-39]|nr:hypothetical protein EP30_04340 [Bifidobacterium sp. UTCIF-39]